jgi:hypothetical protein
MVSADKRREGASRMFIEIDLATVAVGIALREPDDFEDFSGDHTIVVADVLDVYANSEARPLDFFRGAYGTFAAIGGSDEQSRGWSGQERSGR